MVRYLVLIWLCLAATIAYVQRNSLGVAESTIRSQLEISKDAMGWIGAAFFASYALFQLPSGWAAHVLGSRRALPLFSALWSAATGCMALGGGLVSLLSVRFSMGAAQAGIFPCATTTIARWFPVARRSVACGALAAFMSIGGALGSGLTGHLVEGIGWRATFVWFAVPGIVWAAGFWLWFRDSPEEHPQVDEAELALIRGAASPPADDRPSDENPQAPPREPVSPLVRGDDAKESEAGDLAEGDSPAQRIPWSVIVSSPAMWWIGLQQFFRAAGYIFFATWFATYLQETRGVGVAESGMLNALPLLGVVLGSLVGGVISDWLLELTSSRWLARQCLAAASLMCCAGLVVAAFFIRDTMLAVLTISAGQFFASCGGPCAYAITMDLGGRHVTAVFSFMNMCGNVGAFLFPIIVPKLVSRTGAWDAVLFAFALIHVAAALCWLCFNGNRPIVSVEPASDPG
jgi:ACS family glucarate transporter-like MFS transporter